MALSQEDFEQVRQMIRVELAQTLRLDTATVAAVTGDATAWYSAALYLDGATSGPTTEPVRCLRQYTPAVNDRVMVLWDRGQPLYVVGKTN